MIATYVNGTPVGNTIEGPKSYEIEGTLAAGATQRTGAALERAIESVCGFGAGLVTVSGTDVIVEGNVVMTLADGDIDKPANNAVAHHLRWLMQLFPGDKRTNVWHTVKMVARFCRYKQGWTLTRAQWTALCQKAYDAVTAGDSDGE